MARNFNGTTQRLHNSGSFSGATAYPLTLSAWVYPETSDASSTVLGIHDASVADHGAWIQYRTDNKTLAVVQSGGSANSIISTGNITDAAWNHLAGRFIASGNVDVWLNGTETSGTPTATFTGIDTVSIGAKGDSTVDNFSDARICECGVWNTDLTNGEHAALAAGVSPLLVRPGNLVFYYPGHETSGNGFDLVGGLTLTDVASTGHSDHPDGIYYPNAQAHQLMGVPAAMAGGLYLVNGGLVSG